MNNEEIQKKMDALVLKWKGHKPAENTREWWMYRGDQSLWVKLRSQLKEDKTDSYHMALDIFGIKDTT